MSRNAIVSLSQDATLSSLQSLAAQLGLSGSGQSHHQLWKTICLHSIAQALPNNPSVASEMMGAFLCYESVPYSKIHSAILDNTIDGYVNEQFVLFQRSLSDVTALGDFDWTPVYYEFCHKQGARPQTTSNVFWAELARRHLTPDPQSPLLPFIWQTVFEKGYVEDAKILRSFGLTPQWKGADNPYPPYVQKYDPSDCFLALVRSEKAVEVLQQFPDSVVQPWVNHANSVGETPLHHAAKHLLPDYIERLLQLGANPDAKTHSGKLPMDCVKRSKSRTQEIDDTVARLGTGNKSVDDLFILAVRSLSVPLLELSKQKGADLPALACTYDVWSVVFDLKTSQTRINTVRQRQAVFIQYLLNNAVDPRATTTALHLAIEHGAVESVRVLLEHDTTLSEELDHDNQRPSQKYIQIIPHYTARILDDRDKMEHHKGLAALDIAKLYLDNMLDFNVGSYGDFPQIARDTVFSAQLEKLKLQHAVGKLGVDHARKSKI